METSVNIQDLKNSANTIRTNTKPKSNTAVLVGTHLNMINQMLEPMLAILKYFNDKGTYLEVTCSIASKGEVTAYSENAPGSGGGGNQSPGGTTVSWTQTLDSGTKIAEITINGNVISVYAPTPSGSSGGASSWDDLSEKPSWIGSTKPSYSLSEIGGAPTTQKMVAWDDAADKRHSHDNLTNVLQYLTINHLKMLENLCNYVSFDSQGNITFEKNVIGKKEVTAFGQGTTAGGSGSTGGGTSGGQGSGGGYEDGGSTGGSDTGGTTNANWIMHMKDKLTTSPGGYKKPNDIVIYHHDYFDQANDFGGKTIKKVIMRANTTGSSTLYIYTWYGNNYQKEYLTQIGSVSGANNTEISCNISIPANAKIAIKNSAGLAYAFNVSDRYGYVEYDSSVDGYYYTAQMNKTSIFVDFYLE